MSSSSSPCTYVQSLWDILATIIHLGNVTFKEDSKGFAEFGSTEQLDCIAKVNMYVCMHGQWYVRVYVRMCWAWILPYALRVQGD